MTYRDLVYILYRYTLALQRRADRVNREARLMFLSGIPFFGGRKGYFSVLYQYCGAVMPMGYS
jgi:hypothetical protein